MATVLQIAGLATIVTGVALLSVPAGLIIGGLVVSAAGYALGRQQ